MVKSTSTTVSSAAVLFVAACTCDVVHLALGASYDLQVHTCITLDAETFDPVGFKFCTAGQECVTWLLAAPLAAGASITDGLVADSDYTFTLSLGSGVSTVELFLASDDAWCIDQLSLGPTGGTMEQLQTTAVFVDNPCVATANYAELPCVESLQYEFAPVVSSTANLYSLSTVTCVQTDSSSSAILTLLACESDDCYELVLYEGFAEEASSRVVNGIMDVGEMVEWQFWLEAPPSELRLSSFDQLGNPEDGWCFSEIAFELPVGGTALAVSTTDRWLDGPCSDGLFYEGGCQLEYVFDLTGAVSTPAPSVNASDDTADDVSDQDTSTATGCCATAIAWMISVFFAVVTLFG